MLQVEEKISCKVDGSGIFMSTVLKWTSTLNTSSSNNCEKTIRNIEVTTNYDIKCSVKGGSLDRRELLF